MNESGKSNSGSMTLEQLIALNGEIAALSRAGLPLESSLLGMGTDVKGSLGRIAARLGERMSRGESLEQALAAPEVGAPRSYRAVVEAGLRARRLPAALEGLTEFAQGYGELRHSVGQAFLYPMLVLLLAYILFIGFVVGVVPRLAEAFGSLQAPLFGPIVWLERAGDTAIYWAPILPIVLVFAWLLWLRSGRAGALAPGGWTSGFAWLPWMKPILADWRAAHLADWMALLIEHDVPFADTFELAAEATGDAHWIREGKDIADALRRGGDLSDEIGKRLSLPPMLRWLIVSGAERGTLVESLRHAARTYQRRALRRSEVVRTVLPTALLLLIGMTTALAYALTLFTPWSALLKGLGEM